MEKQMEGSVEMEKKTKTSLSDIMYAKGAADHASAGRAALWRELDHVKKQSVKDLSASYAESDSLEAGLFDAQARIEALSAERDKLEVQTAQYRVDLALISSRAEWTTVAETRADTAENRANALKRNLDKSNIEVGMMHANLVKERASHAATDNDLQQAWANIVELKEQIKRMSAAKA